MSSSRNASRERRPESIPAREADKRVSTADGRPRTGDLANLVPDNTPRDTVVNTPLDLDDALSILDQSSDNLPHPGTEKPEDFLDPDELFMTLTEEERQEWEAMMAERSTQMGKALEEHQKWADSFTRRRMFAYCRIRKIQLCYKERVELFSNMAEALKRLSTRKNSTKTAGVKNAELEKRNSEPILSGDGTHKPVNKSRSPVAPPRRNETMIGEKTTSSSLSDNTNDSTPIVTKDNFQTVQQTDQSVSKAKGNVTQDGQESKHKNVISTSKIDLDEDGSDDSGFSSASGRHAPPNGETPFLKVEQVPQGATTSTA